MKIKSIIKWNVLRNGTILVNTKHYKYKTYFKIYVYITSYYILAFGLFKARTIHSQKLNCFSIGRTILITS